MGSQALELEEALKMRREKFALENSVPSVWGAQMLPAVIGWWQQMATEAGEPQAAWLRLGHGSRHFTCQIPTGFTQIKQMDGCGGELAGFISFYITSSIWPLYAFVHFLSCGFVWKWTVSPFTAILLWKMMTTQSPKPCFEAMMRFRAPSGATIQRAFPDSATASWPSPY